MGGSQSWMESGQKESTRMEPWSAGTKVLTRLWCSIRERRQTETRGHRNCLSQGRRCRALPPSPLLSSRTLGAHQIGGLSYSLHPRDYVSPVKICPRELSRTQCSHCFRRLPCKAATKQQSQHHDQQGTVACRPPTALPDCSKNRGL